MSQQSPRVSVVIPTIKRPDGLTRAIDSILLQESVPEDDAEIVVVDNDPEGSAEQVVHRFNNFVPTFLDSKDCHIFIFRYHFFSFLSNLVVFAKC